MTTSASLCEGPIFYSCLILHAKSHGDLHLSFLHFILWQAQCVGKILIYIANWMWVFMNYYCWHYPWGKTLGGKFKPLSFLCVRLKLHTHKYCVSVSNCERLYDSWVCGLAEKLLYIDSFLCYDKLQLLQWLRL